MTEDERKNLARVLVEHLSLDDSMFVALMFLQHTQRAAVLMSAYAGQAMEESEFARLALRIAKQVERGGDAS